MACGCRKNTVRSSPPAARPAAQRVQQQNARVQAQSVRRPQAQQVKGQSVPASAPRRLDDAARRKALRKK